MLHAAYRMLHALSRKSQVACCTWIACCESSADVGAAPKSASSAAGMNSSRSASAPPSAARATSTSPTVRAIAPCASAARESGAGFGLSSATPAAAAAASPLEEARQKEVKVVRQSALVCRAYVSLCLDDPLSSLSAATELRTF